MSKKVYNLVVALIGAAGTAAVALVTYFNPAYASAINAAIGIGTTAAIEIVGLFVDPNKNKIANK